jgi:uncharacterized protein DUF4153
LPAWASTRVAWSARSTAVAAALVVGLLADQALRTGSVGLGATLTFLVGGVVAVTLGRLQRIESRLLVGGAALFAFWFTVRASPWLLWPDLAAALMLLGLATSFSVRGSVFDLGASELAARFFHSSLQLAAGVGFIATPALRARGRMRSAAPYLRGVLLAVPIAAVIAGLLASADPVFASFFRLNIEVGTLLLDVFFVVVGALSAAGMLRIAASEPLERIDGPARRLGATETLVVLAVLDTVFLAFAAAQVMAATGGAADALRSAGVTYADYARSGFFQLLWVAGITLALLIVFGRVGKVSQGRARMGFIALALGAIALTLMVDVVAFRRLGLYEEAYGFTMLRLYSHVFAVWVAVVFLLLGLDFLGVWHLRRWFVGATVVSALLVLLGLNIGSPEAMVVALNTSHAQTAHKIDSGYLAELSSDATPALLDSRERLDPALRSQVTSAACAGSRTYMPPWAAFNFADLQAAGARRAGC